MGGPRAILAGAAAATVVAFGCIAIGAPLRAAVDPLRAALLAMPLTPDLGGDTSRVISSEKAYTYMAENSPGERQRVFFFGNRIFNTNWIVYPASVKSFDGLGPLFNRNSCSGCHVRDGRGEPPEVTGGPMNSMLIRLSGADGKPHPDYGDQLNDNSIPGVKPEGRAIIDYRPVEGTYGDGTRFTLQQPTYRFADLVYGSLDGAEISPRVAPAMIGLGLLEAVPVATLEALADPDDADGDGISGRINWLDDGKGGRIAGRFGWKANVATLRDQAVNAANGDIGLTTSFRPKQNCQASETDCIAALADPDPELNDTFLDKLVTYTRTLAVPVQRDATVPEVMRGADLFRSFGCSACHMPTLMTDANAELPELRNQTFHPFTDLLVHDMGEGLADHRPDGSASGSEWRTPPLWGLGLIQRVNGHDRLLHDGRARGPAEAILWHGGEAKAAREAFRTAPAPDRAALIAFLKSL